MREIRCKKCNRLLMKGKVVTAEIKCPKCGYMNVYQEKYKPLKNFPIDCSGELENTEYQIS